MASTHFQWLKAISFIFVLLLIPANAIPAKKGSAAAASSGGITTATDGSSILDKTVTIKYIILSLSSLKFNC